MSFYNILRRTATLKTGTLNRNLHMTQVTAIYITIVAVTVIVMTAGVHER